MNEHFIKFILSIFDYKTTVSQLLQILNPSLRRLDQYEPSKCRRDPLRNQPGNYDENDPVCVCE